MKRWATTTTVAWAVLCGTAAVAPAGTGYSAAGYKAENAAYNAYINLYNGSVQANDGYATAAMQYAYYAYLYSHYGNDGYDGNNQDVYYHRTAAELLQFAVSYAQTALLRVNNNNMLLARGAQFALAAEQYCLQAHDLEGAPLGVAGGFISSIFGSRVAIHTASGFDISLGVSTSTTITRNGTTIPFGSLVVGTAITSVYSPQTFLASQLEVAAQDGRRQRGTILSLGGNRVTFRLPNGVQTFALIDAYTLLQRNYAAAPLSSFAVGDKIEVRYDVGTSKVTVLETVK